MGAAIVDNLKPRWATELRKDDLEEDGILSNGFNTSCGFSAGIGAGGRADVGAGWGGGIDALWEVPRVVMVPELKLEVADTEPALECDVLYEAKLRTDEPDALLLNVGKLETTLLSLL